MKTKYHIINFAGFVFLVIGGFMKAVQMESGNFLQGFGRGLVLAGSLSLLYNAYTNMKISKASVKPEA